MTTNCCESINSGLNKNCPPLRRLTSVCGKILKHKMKHYDGYIWKVKMNHLSSAKRPKIVTEKFGILSDLCDGFDEFSGSERKENLIRYLKHVCHRDAFSVILLAYSA